MKIGHALLVIVTAFCITVRARAGEVSTVLPGTAMIISQGLLNDDEAVDLVVGFSDGHIATYDGSTLELMETRSDYFSTEINALETGDLDGDGRDEILVSAQLDATVRALDGANLDPVWSYTSTETYPYQSVITLGYFEYLNPDTQLDVALAVGRDFVTLDSDGEVIYQHELGDHGRAMMALDIDGNGVDDIALCYHYNVGTYSFFGQTWDYKGMGYTTAVFAADVNDDGTKDVIAQSTMNHQRTYVLDGRTGDEIWVKLHGDQLHTGDVNADGIPEVGVRHGNEAFVYDGRSGRELYRFEGSGELLFVDIDGYGADEVVYWEYWGQKVRVVDGLNGVEFFGFTGNYGQQRGCRVADYDGDGMAEIATWGESFLAVREITAVVPPEATIGNLQRGETLTVTRELTIHAASSAELASLTVDVDSVTVGSVNIDGEVSYTWTFDVDAIGDGLHLVEVVATDQQGQEGFDRRAIRVLKTPDEEPPVIVITSPEDGYVAEATGPIYPLNVAYEVSDDHNVRMLEVLVDGEVMTRHHDAEIDGTVDVYLSEGDYALTLVAYDDSTFTTDWVANRSEATVSVSVRGSDWMADILSFEPAWEVAISSNPLGIVESLERGDGVTVVTSGGEGVLTAVDFATGEIQATLDFSARIADVVAVDDIDGDGTRDLAIGSEDQTLRLLSGESFVELWSVALEGRYPQAIDLLDYNLDGLRDLVVSVSNYSWIFDVRTGKHIWDSQEGHLEGEYKVSRSIRDINGDTVRDIIIGAYYNEILAIDPIAKNLIWYSRPWPNTNGVYDNVKIGEVTKDGIDDVAGCSDQGKVVVVDGSSGQTLWQRDFGDRADMDLVDCNLDGSIDLVVSLSDRITALTGLNGSKIWEIPLSNSRGITVSAPQSGAVRYILCSTENGLFVLSPINGDIIWQTALRTWASGPYFGITTDNLMRFVPLDDDTLPDIVVAGNNGHLYAFMGEGEKEEEEGDRVDEKVTVFPSTATIVSQGLLNDDEAVDLVVGFSDGHIATYDGSTLELMSTRADYFSTEINALETGDLDGDGRDEILVSAQLDATVRALDGANLDPVWSYTSTETYPYQSVITLGYFEYLNPDTQLDVALAVGRDFVTLDSDGEVIYQHELGDHGRAMMALDIDGNGVDDIALCYHYNVGTYSFFGQTWDYKGMGYTTAVFAADVNDDGTKDVIAQSTMNHQRTYVLDGRTGDEIWVKLHGDQLHTGDVNADGIPEVGVRHGNEAFVYDGRSGRELYRFEGSGELLFVDIDGYGADEVVYWEYWGQKVRVVDGLNGVEFFGFTGNYGQQRGCRVADYDGDGMAEIATWGESFLAVREITAVVPPEATIGNLQRGETLTVTRELTIHAASSAELASLTVDVDSVTVGSVNIDGEVSYTWTFDVDAIGDGLHLVEVVATDQQGQEGFDRRAIRVLKTPDEEPPVIVITSPEDGYVAEATGPIYPLNVAYEVSDDHNVRMLEVLVDGEVMTRHHDAEIDGTVDVYLSEGDYALTLVAYDDSTFTTDWVANRSEATVSVSVRGSDWMADILSFEPAWEVAISSNPLGIVESLERGDGVTVVTSGGEGVLTAVDFATGEIQATLDFSARIADVVAVDDIDGDGTRDLAIGSEDQTLRLLSGESFVELWSVALEGRYPQAIDLLDYNLDGLRDLVVSVSNYSWIFDVRTGKHIWDSQEGHLEGEYKVSRSIRDINGDTVRDIIIGAYYNEILAIDPIAKNLIWYSRPWPNTNGVYDNVKIGEVTKDGIDDVAGCSDQGKVVVVDGSSGQTLWQRDFGDRADMDLVDCNLDGSIDLVVSLSDRITALTGLNGSKIWEIPLSNSRGITVSAPQSGAVRYILCSTENGLFVLSPINGDIIWQTALRTWASGPYFGITTDNLMRFVPLDDDTLPDIVVAGNNGHLYAFMGEITTSIENPVGWSMVSLPLEVEDPVLASVFPEAISLYELDPESGYSPTTAFEAGKGYWINLSKAVKRVINGAPHPNLELTLVAGWNMVGPGPIALDMATMKTTYPELVSVLGYDGGYETVTEMEPGRGYWMDLSAPTVIDLSGTVAAAAKPVAGQAQADDGVSGAVLWFESEGRRQQVELGIEPERVVRLPPLPPAGAFDVRVEMDEIDSWQVPWSTMGTAYPVHVQGNDVTLGWEIPPANEGQWELQIADALYLLAGQQVLDLGDAIPKIELRQRISAPLPHRFSLGQNYPNPFNPGTTIQFSLSRSGEIELTIHNITGQKVATLADGLWEAGTYSVRWDGRDDHGREQASGVYLYRLTNDEQVETRKLILLR